MREYEGMWGPSIVNVRYLIILSALSTGPQMFCHFLMCFGYFPVFWVCRSDVENALLGLRRSINRFVRENFVRMRFVFVDPPSAAYSLVENLIYYS